MSCKWNCSAPYVAVASGPDVTALLLPVAELPFEVLPSPPFTQASEAIAKTSRIITIRIINLFM